MLDRSSQGSDLPFRQALCLSFALVLLSLSLLTPNAQAGDVASFLENYRAAVKQQETRLASIEVEAVVASKRGRDPKTGQPKRLVSEFIYTRNPKHEKYQTQLLEGIDPDKPQHEVRVTVQGVENNFWLYKQNPQSDFAITYLETPTANSKDALNRQRGFLINAWSHLGSHSIGKLLEMPEFRIERVEPEGNLLGVDFSCPPGPSHKLFMTGHFVVDPAQGMAIRRQDVRRWPPNMPDRISTVRTEATYRMVDGLALPDEVDVKFGSPAVPDMEHMHLRAKRVSTAAVPDSAFTLAAFGLGDLERPAPRSRFDLAYWTIGLAGVAFGLAAFFKWRSRQAARLVDQASGLSG